MWTIAWLMAKWFLIGMGCVLGMFVFALGGLTVAALLLPDPKREDEEDEYRIRECQSILHEMGSDRN